MQIPTIGSVRRIRMLIQTIQKGFEAFKYKFDPIEKDLNHSNVNSNNSNAKSNHLSKIQSIQMQIRTLQTRFEALDCKF